MGDNNQVFLLVGIFALLCVPSVAGGTYATTTYAQSQADPSCKLNEGCRDLTNDALYQGGVSNEKATLVPGSAAQCEEAGQDAGCLIPEVVPAVDPCSEINPQTGTSVCCVDKLPIHAGCKLDANFQEDCSTMIFTSNEGETVNNSGPCLTGFEKDGECMTCKELSIFCDEDENPGDTGNKARASCPMTCGCCSILNNPDGDSGDNATVPQLKEKCSPNISFDGVSEATPAPTPEVILNCDQTTDPTCFKVKACKDLRNHNDAPWTDKDGATCAVYAQRLTSEGRSWCSAFGTDSKFAGILTQDADSANNLNVGASEACCACGGGTSFKTQEQAPRGADGEIFPYAINEGIFPAEGTTGCGGDAEDYCAALGGCDVNTSSDEDQCPATLANKVVGANACALFKGQSNRIGSADFFEKSAGGDDNKFTNFPDASSAMVLNNTCVVPRENAPAKDLNSDGLVVQNDDTDVQLGPWTDPQGFTCADYVNNGWCTSEGNIGSLVLEPRSGGQLTAGSVKGWGSRPLNPTSEEIAKLKNNEWPTSLAITGPSPSAQEQCTQMERSNPRIPGSWKTANNNADNGAFECSTWNNLGMGTWTEGTGDGVSVPGFGITTVSDENSCPPGFCITANEDKFLCLLKPSSPGSNFVLSQSDLNGENPFYMEGLVSYSAWATSEGLCNSTSDSDPVCYNEAIGACVKPPPATAPLQIPDPTKVLGSELYFTSGGTEDGGELARTGFSNFTQATTNIRNTGLNRSLSAAEACAGCGGGNLCPPLKPECTLAPTPPPTPPPSYDATTCCSNNHSAPNVAISANEVMQECLKLDVVPGPQSCSNIDVLDTLIFDYKQAGIKIPPTLGECGDLPAGDVPPQGEPCYNAVQEILTDRDKMIKWCEENETDDGISDVCIGNQYSWEVVPPVCGTPIDNNGRLLGTCTSNCTGPIWEQNWSRQNEDPAKGDDFCIPPQELYTNEGKSHAYEMTVDDEMSKNINSIWSFWSWWFGFSSYRDKMSPEEQRKLLTKFSEQTGGAWAYNPLVVDASRASGQGRPRGWWYGDHESADAGIVCPAGSCFGKAKASEMDIREVCVKDPTKQQLNSNTETDVGAYYDCSKNVALNSQIFGSNPPDTSTGQPGPGRVILKSNGDAGKGFTGINGFVCLAGCADEECSSTSNHLVKLALGDKINETVNNGLYDVPPFFNSAPGFWSNSDDEAVYGSPLEKFPVDQFDSRFNLMPGASVGCGEGLTASGEPVVGNFVYYAEASDVTGSTTDRIRDVSNQIEWKGLTRPIGPFPCGEGAQIASGDTGSPRAIWYKPTVKYQNAGFDLSKFDEYKESVINACPGCESAINDVKDKVAKQQKECDELAAAWQSAADKVAQETIANCNEDNPDGCTPSPTATAPIQAAADKVKECQSKLSAIGVDPKDCQCDIEPFQMAPVIQVGLQCGQPVRAVRSFVGCGDRGELSC